MLPELLVLWAPRATHGLHHLLVELHGRREELGIPAEDVAKVNVNQVTCVRQQEVVKVTVSDAQQVGNHTVAGFEGGGEGGEGWCQSLVLYRLYRCAYHSS